MLRFLIRLGVSLALAALALFIASLLVPGMHLQLAGFFVAIIVFAAVQALMEWLVETLFHRGAPAVAGVAGLISTAVALFVASIGAGITFDGVAAWVLAAVIVWIITALAAWLSGKYLLPKVAPAKRS